MVEHVKVSSVRGGGSSTGGGVSSTGGGGVF